MLGPQGREDVKFRNKVKTLIQNITKTRNRRASGPVQPLTSFPLNLFACFCLILMLMSEKEKKYSFTSKGNAQHLCAGQNTQQVKEHMYFIIGN